MPTPTPTSTHPSAVPAVLSPAQVAREFRDLLAQGAVLKPDGRASKDPLGLLKRGFTPRYRFDLFGSRFYLTNVRQNPLLRFFVAYVLPPTPTGRRQIVHPRIYYKDVSLIWRCGSHIVYSDTELWIGKGDVSCVHRDGYEYEETMESTTDLPFEMQTALETLMERAGKIRRNTRVLADVLRNAPAHRIGAYRDFTEPRRLAALDPSNLVHGGKRVARFKRANDPSSLTFVKGYEPDFRKVGLLDVASSRSSSYGGTVERYRILSRNGRIQYLFFAAPGHVWMAPPQALTTELSSYGVRTVEPLVDDDLSLPGYEYHFLEYADEPESLHSQIPEGFAGAPNPKDPDRADTSAWLDQMPAIQQFRRKILGRAG